MQIWVDADACPNVVKEILFKAALRRKVGLTLVANTPLSVPSSPLIHTIRVAAGLDEADKEIAKLVEPGIWLSRLMCPWPTKSWTRGRPA